ncbi:MAG TPA: family 16 glycoside hydrolase [Planctomycetota bacterium]|nr:family 16 glycoside hydrolase [Planctomycetota bacterium]
MRTTGRVLAISLCAAFSITQPVLSEEEGFKPIFNGKDLAGWDGNPDLWRVEDGAITGETTAEKPTKGNTFIIWRAGQTVDDFELKLEYRIQGGNSGIQYRSFELEKWVAGGYQADIDSGDRYSGILYGERDRGILAERGQKTVIGEDHKPRVVGTLGDSKDIQAKIKKDDWNEYRIVAKGNRLLHEINGVKTAEVVDEDKPAAGEAKGRRASGILAFQLHAGPSMKVQFRNVRLKRTPLESAKKVVFVAGHASHGFGAHDHKAGCYLLKNRLEESGLGILGAVYHPDWPADPTFLDNANALVIYSDGGGGAHPINKHVDEVMPLAKKGLGLGFIHYAVEVEKGKVGDAMLEWTGGYFEMHRSVNPHWTIKDAVLAKDHPITRGVKPYSINDEWYFFMRFPEKMEGVTPILGAVAPPETMSRPDGAHSGNKYVRESVKRGDVQHVMWARQRSEGGRGFGFTGGHVHWNWGHPEHRKLVLNAIAWIAGAEVPSAGVLDKPVTMEELMANHDEKPPQNFKEEAIKKKIDEWQAGK